MCQVCNIQLKYRYCFQRYKKDNLHLEHNQYENKLKEFTNKALEYMLTRRRSSSGYLTDQRLGSGLVNGGTVSIQSFQINCEK